MNNEAVRQTLDQAGATLGHVFDDYIPASVLEKSVERGRLLVVGNTVAHLRETTISLGEDLDLIASGVLEQEPAKAQHCQLATLDCRGRARVSGFTTGGENSKA